jgi:hypothetical protein
MPVLGPNNTLTINGKPILYQGIARLRPDLGVDPATKVDIAIKTTKGNGIDEMVFGFTGPDGKAERIIIWGDQLDFRWRERQAPPEVILNGQRGVMLHNDDEQGTATEAGVFGLIGGIKLAFESIETVAKKAVTGGAMLVGATAALGGIVWVAATQGAAMGPIARAIAAVAPYAGGGLAAISLAAIGLLLLSGLVKAMANTLGTPPKYETIAAVIIDRPDEQPPPAPAPAPPIPPAPAPPTGQQTVLQLLQDLQKKRQQGG